jgi:glycosyltransferase involved in cell wall biosynthesis
MNVSKPRISVIIPALNEAASIGLVIRDIPPGLAAEIIVVDNGSTDGTADIARQSGARVVHELHRGYGAACLAGIAAAGNPEIIAFLDGDYSDYPEELGLLAEPVINGEADLVIGSRMAGADAGCVLPPQAYWGNRLATFLLRLLYGFRFTDLGPFRVIRAQSLKALGMRDRNFGWTIEMQIKAVQRGLRIQEIPVRYRHRIGQSKISGTLSGSIQAGCKILYTIGKYSLKKTPKID